MNESTEREKTPTPGSRSSDTLSDPAVSSTASDYSPSSAAAAPKGSLVFYDPILSAALQSSPSVAGHESVSSVDSRDAGGGVLFVPGDAPEENVSQSSHSTMADQGRGGSGASRRFQSQSQAPSGPLRRPSGRPAHNPPPSHHVFPISAAQTPQNPQDAMRHSPGGPSAFQGPPPQYRTSSSHYSPRSNYGGHAGQYTLPPQSPMSMGQPHGPFSYSHGFVHPGLQPQPDTSSLMPPQNIHVGYQPMMQPHGPVYQYQRHSPEGNSGSQPPFHGSSTPSIYAHISPSPPPHSPIPSHSPSAQSGAGHSGNYPGQTGPFRSLSFPSPMSTTPYAYPTQSFSPPPVYQSQYGPSPYTQHYSAPSEQEGQGTWWYMPHGPPVPSRQFDGVQQPFQGHYQMGYPQMGHRADVESSYSPSGMGPSSSALYHPMSPSVLQSHLGHSPGDPVSSSSSSAGGQQPAASVIQGRSETSVAGKSERPVVRRSYHPNPPPSRSEWVMWCGNVPSDTTHDELWRFFNTPLPSSPGSSSEPSFNPVPSESESSGGVISIFLISRSNCAFVNFETEAHLKAAIARFNGQLLRPHDPHCQKLVCRVRRKDDDLRAGVGGQRGMGMHIRWIKEQKGKGREPQETSDPSSTDPSEVLSSPSADSEELPAAVARMSLSSDEEEGQNLATVRARGKKHSSSSGSYASTSSSVLTKYFPKRYFILKSLTQYDLDLSVKEGIWATQKHNEGILDQAYRTSREVYLIFGVNKSGEFYGYARMAGPILHGEHRVSWAARSSDSPSSTRSSASPGVGRGSLKSETIPEESDGQVRLPEQREGGNLYFPATENRLVERSPAPVSPPNQPPYTYGGQSQGIQQVMTGSKQAARTAMSAPAELGRPHQRFSTMPPLIQHSLDFPSIRPVSVSGSVPGGSDEEKFELDRSAPARHLRRGKQREIDSPLDGTSLPKVEEEDDERPDGSREALKDGEGGGREEGWGESFKVEWLSTQRLPFYRTRHLRNSWNHDREIKVSRDGTELEPTVGQKLLDEWSRLADPQQQPPPPPSGSKRGGASAKQPAPPAGSTLSREANSRS